MTSEIYWVICPIALRCRVATVCIV